MNSAADPIARAPTDWKGAAMQRRLRRRYRAEWCFRLLGLSAVIGSAAFLVVLLVAVLGNGLGGFVQTRIALPIDLARQGIAIDPARLHGPGANLALAAANIEGATDAAAKAAFGPGGDDLLSDSAWLTVRDAIKADPTLLAHRATIAVPAADAIDSAAKGHGDAAAQARFAGLQARGAISRGVDWGFLTGADSTDSTSAGIWGALKGSIFTMLVTLVLAFPVGMLAALYLEEYAPRNRWTDLIEVSINNLAAVPSITFGLLGLAVFLGTMHLPRSAPLVGGLTLALMTMPVIVIAGRNAIK
ncbi:MAG: phosphate transporter permease, partial [Sphingomonas bacterium]|nr:phosphate transporter permease [Sphingomonas bacterium]